MKLYYYLITLALTIVTAAAPVEELFARQPSDEPYEPLPPYNHPPAYHGPHGPPQPPTQGQHPNRVNGHVPRATHETAARAHRNAMDACAIAIATANRVDRPGRAQQLQGDLEWHRQSYDRHIAAEQNPALAWPSSQIQLDEQGARESEQRARTTTHILETLIQNREASAPQNNPHVQHQHIQHQHVQNARTDHRRAHRPGHDEAAEARRSAMQEAHGMGASSCRIS